MMPMKIDQLVIDEAKEIASHLTRGLPELSDKKLTILPALDAYSMTYFLRKSFGICLKHAVVGFYPSAEGDMNIRFLTVRKEDDQSADFKELILSYDLFIEHMAAFEQFMKDQKK